MARMIATVRNAVGFCVVLGTGIVAQAGSITFNFTGTPGNVGSSSESFTAGGYTVTAYGFNNDSETSPHGLYNKNDGGGETGLGLVSTLDNELTLKPGGSLSANFIQLDVSQVDKVLSSATIAIGSVTGPEKYDLYGSNTRGALGTLLAGGLSATSALIPQWGQDSYISVAVHADPSSPCDNILVGGLTGSAVTTLQTVPEPSSILMLASSLAVGTGIVLFRRARTRTQRRGLPPRA
jgi:hypothetical protein